jgi:hypothetical protein
VNFSSQPIETIFFFPRDIDSVITKIVCEFTLQDGTKRSIETRVEERVIAECKFEDAVASGKTAVFGSYSHTNQDLMRISIGQFPPLSRAELRIQYF